MIVVIGEALVDEFPAFHRIGGAPLNFAVHVHHLGEPVRLITRIGRDEHGEAILRMLARRGMDASGVQIDAKRDTGTVRVTVSADGTPEYDITENVAYDAIDPPPLDDRVRMVYFGTLAQRTRAAFHRIQAFLDSCPATCQRYLDINLRPGCYRSASIEGSLKKADVLKLNEDEWNLLHQLLFQNVKKNDLHRRLMARYGISSILLTRGRDGAVLFGPDGKAARAPAAPVPRMVDSVGAGDAFAAVWAVGWLRGAPPQRILAAAAAFSAHICGLAGALPDDLECYREVSQALEGGQP